MRSTFKALAIVVGATAAAGIATAEEQDRVVAAMITADGEVAGTVTFRPTPHGVVVRAELANMPPGLHGLHIHETGACEPDFQAAGGHYAPEGHEHGYDNPQGYHLGDLPNVYIDQDGVGIADYFVPRLTLAAGGDSPPYTLNDKDGSAVMIHEGADSYNEKSGTGARIACGVIFPATD